MAFWTALARGASRAASAAKWGADKALRGFGGAGLGYSERAKAKTGKDLDEWSLNHLRTQNAQAIQRLIETVYNVTDTFAHAISVKVRGGPVADLRSCYYLALAAAFGRFGRSFTRISGSYFEMGCHTDVTNKEVTVTIGHRTTMWGDIQRSARRFGRQSDRGPFDVMYEGPDQVTIGAGWAGSFVAGDGGVANPNATLDVGYGFAQSTGATTAVRVGSAMTVATGSTKDPGTVSKVAGSVNWVLRDADLQTAGAYLKMPFTSNKWRLAVDSFRELPVEATSTQAMYLRRWASLKSGRPSYVLVGRTENCLVPILPDDGRLITTGETNSPYVQPPRPPIDAVAKGSFLDLVAQALSRPGFLPARPPGKDTAVIASSGVYVRNPGTVNVGDQAKVIRILPPSAVNPNQGASFGTGGLGVTGVVAVAGAVVATQVQTTAPKISETP